VPTSKGREGEGKGGKGKGKVGEGKEGRVACPIAESGSASGGPGPPRECEI